MRLRSGSFGNRRQQILHIVSQLNGARAYGESLAQREVADLTMPGMASEDSRDHDLLTTHAADLVPVEMPWAGTPRTPLMLFETPYRQLIPFSPFDAGLENANAIVAAASGAGKERSRRTDVVDLQPAGCAGLDHRAWRFLPPGRDVHGRPDDLHVARQPADDQPVRS